MYLVILLISGAATALPLIFNNLFLISWMSMIPLFWVCYRKGPRFRWFMMFGAGYFGLSYHWFTEMYPLDFAGFGKFTGAVAVAVCWIGLALLQTLWISLAAPLMRLCAPLKNKCGRWIYPFYAAAVWTFIEWTMTKTWLGVPFSRLALTQSGCLPMIQSASIFGSLFISFLIVAVNAMLAVGFTAVKTEKKERGNKSPNNRVSNVPVHAKRAKKLVPGETAETSKSRSSVRTMTFSKNLFVVAAAVIIITNYSFGIMRMAFYETGDNTLRAAVIQGNISSSEKWESLTASDALEKYIALSETAAEDCEPDIIVWPETVINVDLTYYESYAVKIEQLAVETEAVILVGAFDTETSYDDEENRIVSTYNAVYAFFPDGTAASLPYYKRKLVPFGEYMPMKKVIGTILPILSDMNLTGNDLTPGTDSNVFETSAGKIGSLICFDSIYEQLARDSVLDGAQLLVLSTNDSWYGDSSAVTLHHSHAVLRATESGRYIVRAASTGISSVISPTGQKITSLGVNEEGYIYGDVEMKSDKTLFIVFGDVFVLFCAALIMTGAVMTAVPRVGKLRSNVGEKLKNAKVKRENKEKKENSD